MGNKSSEGIFILLGIIVFIAWKALPYILLILGVILCIYIVYFFCNRQKKKNIHKSQDCHQIVSNSSCPDTNANITHIAINDEVANNDGVCSNNIQIQDYSSPELLKLGAEWKIDNDLHIFVSAPDSVDLQALLYYGKQLKDSINVGNSITYELNNYNKITIITILYEEVRGSAGILYKGILRFNDSITPSTVIKKEFFSDFCINTHMLIHCYLRNLMISAAENTWLSIIERGIANINNLSSAYNDKEKYIIDILNKSDYNDLFNKEIEVDYANYSVVINYKLPSKEDFLSVKEYKYNAKTNKIEEKLYSDSFISKAYEKALYSICLRSIYEIFSMKNIEEISNVTFNGYVNHINKANGKWESKFILSISVNRESFNDINLSDVDPKLCFKSLKGVSASKIIDIVAITPILTFDKTDKRFIEGRNVDINSGTNLAIMEWAEFEHLVRELFELEFSKNGSEVKVTQASRDGGVDAIIFDPDPLRGGKIVVQAKRYTNTVGVSAVRDLYGTVINEGANTGILITTSDYGSDSYAFAKDKPIKLLNGGHLLGLLERHGKKAYIDIVAAKNINN